MNEGNFLLAVVRTFSRFARLQLRLLDAFQAIAWSSAIRMPLVVMTVPMATRANTKPVHLLGLTAATNKSRIAAGTISCGHVVSFGVSFGLNSYQYS